MRRITDSPFQSELLIDEWDFKRAFPHDDGYRQFLIRVPAGKERKSPPCSKPAWPIRA